MGDNLVDNRWEEIGRELEADLFMNNGDLYFKLEDLPDYPITDSVRYDWSLF